MLLNAATLTSLFTTLKATFNKAFDAAPTQWEKIAMLVPSTTAQNDYGWIANFPRMRKWIGEKVVKALAGFKYTIVNDDWEATVEVDRNHIEDDNLGIYGPQAKAAAESAKQLPDEIVFDLVNSSFGATCYDGQYFFDTDHDVAGSSVSNKLTVALSAASLAAATASYGVARAAMLQFKDEDGRPLNINPNILLVPPALEGAAKILMTADKFGDDANPYKGTAEVVMSPRLTSSTAWFLLDGTKPLMPFIYQERKKPVFVQQVDPQSDGVFLRKKFLFGAEARASGGYALWQLAIGSTGAG